MIDFSQVTTEDLRSFIDGTFPGELGIEPVEIGAERARGRLRIGRRHLHPGNAVHGGVWTAFGDTVAAWATFHNIPPGADLTTIELKLNAFASAIEGDLLEATATPLHAGRTTVVIQVKIEREREGERRLAANLIVTNFVVPAPA